jgi:hypothetical protein
MSRVGREWEVGRLPLRGILRQSDDWLARTWIGFDRGRSVLQNPANTELIRRRVDFPYHSDARHRLLLERGGITRRNWIPATKFVRILAEIHGIRLTVVVE